MIRELETLTLLIAAHLQLGEASLASLLLGTQVAEAVPSGGDEAVLRALHGMSPSRQVMSSARHRARQLIECGVRAITFHDTVYPERLRRLLGEKAPPVLYVMGNLALFEERSVAIIGTRKPSAVGREAARSYAGALGRAGWMVTSGNAPGVDAAAHSGALEAGGSTLVYPPMPLDAYKPNFDLADAGAARVLVASPFPPGTAVEAWRFLRRNELVAAQAGASLVAETGTRGGTLNTVKHVRRLRRVLFVTALPDEAPHRRAHEMLAAGGARWLPVECTGTALRTLLKEAERPLPSAPAADDLFSSSGVQP